MQIHNAIADIWAHLDSKFSLTAIASALISGLKPLGFQLFQTDNLKADQALACQELSSPTPASVPDVSNKHGTEYLTLDFAVHDPTGKWIATFADCNWPEKASPSSTTIPTLQNNPALRIELIRSTEGSYPSVSAHMLFSVGAFGLRHLDLQAMLAVIASDLQFGGANARLSDLQQALIPLLQNILAFETKYADVYRTLQGRCAATSLTLLQPFASNENFLVVGSKLTSVLELNLQKDPWQIPNKDELELNYWVKRFDQDFEAERALRYLGVRKQEDQYAKKLVSTCVQAGKHTWPQMIQILGQKPISHVAQLEIISFIADPNWPGASQAERIIDENLELFHASLVASVKIAMDAGDPDWANRVRRLLGEEVDED